MFSSAAPDLITGDDNRFSDIFLSTTNAPTSASYTPSSITTVTRISNSAFPGQEPDGDSYNPKISADGRYVVFSSQATNLVSPAIVNANGTLNVFRYDINTGTTILVSKSKVGAPGNGASTYPQISFNGRYVGYFSNAINIVGSQANNPSFPFIIRYDASIDVNEQVNIAEDGITNGAGQLSSLGLSNNGRLVTFADSSGNLVAGDTSDQTNVYVKDFETGKITRLSTGVLGDAADGPSLNPVLTATSLNGLSFTAAFESLATNLTSPSTSSGSLDVYSTGFTIAAPSLGANTTLETPPDVTVERRRLRITAQSFTLSSTNATRGVSINARQRRATRRGIRYEFNVTLTTTKNGRRRSVRTTTISKRNAITVAKIRNGSYQIKNRVRIINTKTGKTISRTGFSPTLSLKAT